MDANKNTPVTTRSLFGANGLVVAMDEVETAKEVTQEAAETVGVENAVEITEAAAEAPMPIPEPVAEPVVEDTSDTETEAVINVNVNIETEAEDTKSMNELTAQKEAIENKIKAKQEAEKNAVIDQIKHVLESYKISLEDLVTAMGGLKIKRTNAKAKPKYRNSTTGAVWSGRGKPPLWIKGQNYATFLIAE